MISESLAGIYEHADLRVYLGRQLSVGRLGPTMDGRLCDPDYEKDRALALAVRHIEETSIAVQCTQGRPNTPVRSALKCKSKSEEFSVVLPRQVQFVDEGHA